MCVCVYIYMYVCMYVCVYIGLAKKICSGFYTVSRKNLSFWANPIYIYTHSPNTFRLCY